MSFFTEKHIEWTTILYCQFVTFANSTSKFIINPPTALSKDHKTEPSILTLRRANKFFLPFSYLPATKILRIHRELCERETPRGLSLSLSLSRKKTIYFADTILINAPVVAHSKEVGTRSRKERKRRSNNGADCLSSSKWFSIPFRGWRIW